MGTRFIATKEANAQDSNFLNFDFFLKKRKKKKKLK